MSRDTTRPESNSEFIRHDKCNHCPSSDAVAVYDFFLTRNGRIKLIIQHDGTSGQCPNQEPSITSMN